MFDKLKSWFGDVKASSPTAPFVRERYEAERKKLAAYMGERYKERDHICNACAAEAGLTIRCRCTYSCSKHAKKTAAPEYKMSGIVGAAAKATD